ncbi:rod shape-determining protein MreD [Herbinix hemicellulosilytica]|uniref:Putative membrane protein n=1 Tax=Herbinix hemicellulosilytica TaxID=1564487 RepID=A0A0H5SFU6_HERHM|nr:rod shape-determining protein MreD [Herbinix hemicellulosilytica]RBP60675.1 rod shape-determining protein MreD [Herbinix hemicellulosilytica]CRZ34362.1 putative membrane protein [Herbinix hemicellulosilytica]
MKRAIIYFLEIIICFVLQSSLYQFINLANVMPNLLIILVVATAYMRGKTTGMTVGFFSGLLVDIQFGNLIGLYALLMMLIGYVAGFANKIYSRDDYTLPLFFIAIADFVYQFLYYILEFLIRGRLDFLYYLRAKILPEIIYTVAVSVILYKLLHMINHCLDRNENEEE